MRYLGIDYGTKNIGVALSDETNTLAFPLQNILNDDAVITRICDICKEHAVTAVVLGESKDFQGQENAVMEEIHQFKTALQNQCNISVIWEPEFMTTMQASRIQGDHPKIDSSAAAIILQSYLSRH